MYKDNRCLPIVDLRKKEKYHPHVETTIKAFKRWVSNEYYESILDIGTRDGYAVSVLNSDGYDCVGWELVPQYVKYARALGRNVIECDIMNPDKSKSFDAILSRHCIEHVERPDLFIANCASLMDTGAILFITFPSENKHEWSKRDKPDHLCYFESKGDFRIKTRADYYFKELSLCRSKALGIIENGKEYCFIGERK